jgi:hypothetical protein
VWPTGRTLSHFDFGLPQLAVADHPSGGNDFFIFVDRLIAEG